VAVADGQGAVTPCPDDEEIAAFLEGTLAASKNDALESHAWDCATCSALLAEAIKARRALAAVVALEPTEVTGPDRARSARDPARNGVEGDRPRTLQPVRAERYDLGIEIAHGGMGRVRRARDLHLGRQIAVKELLTERPDLVARFEREALITARLQHPAIVPVYEAGRWPSGEVFYAMRLVEGRSLDKVMAGRPTLAARLELLPNVLDVADAIGYAHDQGIIHRDIKPANVLVGAHGDTVVIDWGLAKDLREPPGESDPAAALAEPAPAGASDSGAGETQVGQIMGTPAYMPPEQARGPARDPRADVYALGALLYYVLSGTPPYVAADGPKVLQALVAGPPARLAERQPGLPPDLVAIVEKAMARDARERYPSARELAEDLRRFQTGQLVAVHRYTTWQLVRRFARRHVAALSVGGLALVVLATVGSVSIVKVLRAEHEAIRARDDAERTSASLLGEQGDELLAEGRSQDDLGYRLAHAVKRTPAEDFSQALPLEQKACAAGNLEACMSLGVMYEFAEGVPQDYAQALTLYQRVCDGGEPQGCGQLGSLYAHGRGVPLDYGRAIDLFQAACQAGEPRSCGQLGGMYVRAHGVPQDFAQALTLLERACNGGSANGCVGLGGLYDRGDGVTQDFGKALTLYKQGCDADDAHGCDALGSLYALGHGTAQSYTTAQGLFEKACEGGEAEGCENLGELYLQGQGVPADPATAKALFARACQGGKTDACGR
jgi:TPR repeat protein